MLVKITVYVNETETINSDDQFVQIHHSNL